MPCRDKTVLGRVSATLVVAELLQERLVSWLQRSYEYLTATATGQGDSLCRSQSQEK